LVWFGLLDVPMVNPGNARPRLLLLVVWFGLVWTVGLVRQDARASGCEFVFLCLGCVVLCLAVLCCVIFIVVCVFVFVWSVWRRLRFRTVTSIVIVEIVVVTILIVVIVVMCALVACFVLVLFTSLCVSMCVSVCVVWLRPFTAIDVCLSAACSGWMPNRFHRAYLVYCVV
jgi:hypothetical protein